jgi:hypothetical protein
MPFKANAARRHHIPKQKRKVTNWAAYDASLRQRGSLTVWFTDEATGPPRNWGWGVKWILKLAAAEGEGPSVDTMEISKGTGSRLGMRTPTG